MLGHDHQDGDYKLVLVTGASGLVGEAIADEVNGDPEYWSTKRIKFTFVSSKDADLTDTRQTSELFKLHKPNYVIHLAAKVGGLFANMNDNESFFRINQAINNNVLRVACEFRVEKCISCLSTCIFPDKIDYPLDETKIHLGPPHSSNYGYSLAKRQVDLLNKHYNRLNPRSLFTAVIPTNVYGPKDNFNLETAHVIPSLIHKVYKSISQAQAFNQQTTTFTVCGTGNALRQFIYSRDVARLTLWCLLNYEDEDPILLCTDERDEVSISHVSKFIAETMSKRFGTEITAKFDTRCSDGQIKKTASNQKLRDLYNDFEFTSLRDGLLATIEWFCNSYPAVRK